jgi:protein TonB
MVNPLYPENAIAHRRQGIVFLEALIAPCVSRAEVQQRVSPDLDVSALRAVSGWQYTPTVLNGQPVPVIMMITVQFSLQ